MKAKRKQSPLSAEGKGLGDQRSQPTRRERRVREQAHVGPQQAEFRVQQWVKAAATGPGGQQSEKRRARALDSHPALLFCLLPFKERRWLINVIQINEGSEFSLCVTEHCGRIPGWVRSQAHFCVGKITAAAAWKSPEHTTHAGGYPAAAGRGPGESTLGAGV